MIRKFGQKKGVPDKIMAAKILVQTVGRLLIRQRSRKAFIDVMIFQLTISLTGSANFREFGTDRSRIAREKKQNFYPSPFMGISVFNPKRHDPVTGQKRPRLGFVGHLKA